jgi:hypothetical protein
MNTHPAELGLIDGGQKPLIVAGHQHMVTSMVLGQLFKVMPQRAQQRRPAIGIVGLYQAHNLVVNGQAIRTVAVPINSSQINIQPGVDQGLRQQAEQTLTIDRLTRRTYRALLGHPDQKPTVNQCHTGARAVFAKAAVGRDVVRKIIALHAVNLINKK